MGSAASTDDAYTTSTGGHRLTAGVQVRKERDGLLFYNRKGPRLTFLGSGDLLAVTYFGSGCRLHSWLDNRGVWDSRIRCALACALTDLVEKGVLIVDSSGA
jgi:putative mycofactocin binding protein MftB